MSSVPQPIKNQTLPDQVTLNGTIYSRTATAAAAPKVGIAVTTHNRSDIAKRCLDSIITNTTGAHLVVVDDASDEPFSHDGATVFRFDQQQGIARAKNKCIELLMDAGVEHLFLFDDDCWPTDPAWIDLYAQHPEPHLCFLFKDRNNRGQILLTPKTTYDDGTMYALDHPRGCLLYMHRSVIDRVGGYRKEFGIWGNEHVEYSRRVFNAGLTLQPFQDVSASSEYIYSLDADPKGHPGFARSVSDKVRREELARNDVTLAKFIDSSDYVEYRSGDNAVITALFTGVVDPQRRKKWAADPALIDTWKKSITGARAIVLHDELPDAPDFIKVPGGNNPYLQRWCAFFQYLRSCDHQFVFCTDGSDVTMLRPPWNDLEPGQLYVGYEPTVVGIPWMLDNHPQYKNWIEANKNKMLLNCGVVGGDRVTVMEFCRDLAAELIKTESQLDMGAFNFLAYSEKWWPRIVTGPRVTSLFKKAETEKTNQWSWFAHK